MTLNLENLLNIFNKILNLGLSSSDSDDDKKRIRILNGICFFVGVIIFIFSIIAFIITITTITHGNSTLKPDYDIIRHFFSTNSELSIAAKRNIIIFIPIIDLFFAILLIFSLYLNYLKKFKISVFILITITIFFASIFYLYSRTLALWYFLLVPILPFIFYRKKTSFISFWVITYIIFFLITLLLDNLDVLHLINTPKEFVMRVLIINFTAVYIILFVVVNHFKSENLKNEKKLYEKNQLLTSQTEKIKNQHDEIFVQKTDIELKNKNITASITYAKRIQNAVLSSDDFISLIIPEHFIYNKPKDIVSGDFYFIKQIRNQIVIFVADCTGHGVPGALMSMLGIALLNEIVMNTPNLSANLILDDLRERIKKSLQQQNLKNEQKEGMDASLCIINIETNQLNFAGANNPLFLFRNNEINIFEPDKMPIGIFPREKPFTNQIFQIQKNDVLYMFSDGYYSQFDETNKNTFKTKKFTQLLSNIHLKPFSEQEDILEKELNNWKGKNTQTDDILIVGIKYNM